MTLKPRVRPDTRRCAGLTPAWLAVAAACLVLATVSRAEPREVNAQVVWTRADRIYLATPDSALFEPGTSLTFFHGKRTLATGVVEQLLEPRLAVARLTGGSLARERHLARLRVRGEAAAVPSLPVLRVGIPGRGRGSLLATCGAVAVAPRFGAAICRVDSLARDAFRLVPD